MKKIQKWVTVLYFSFLSLMLLPFITSTAVAATESPTSGNCPKGNNFTTLKELLSNQNFNGTDPSKGLGSVRCFVFELTKIALTYASILAIIMILYGAFLYTTSYGEDAKIETAKKTLQWSIIGLVVLALAYVIVNVLLNEISAVPATTK